MTKSKTKSQSIMVFIKKLAKKVFTTHELVSISDKSASTIVQSLDRMANQGLLVKIYRGVWADSTIDGLSAFEVIPCLFPRQRAYVSFITALHLHGMIEQIPQVMTLASTSHTRTMRTKAGVFSVHQIAPSFFDGFDWYKGEGHCNIPYQTPRTRSCRTNMFRQNGSLPCSGITSQW